MITAKVSDCSSAGGDGSVIAINPDGTQKWVFSPTNGAAGPIPSIAADGTLYVGSFGGILYAINSDGTPKWQFSIG